MSVNVDSLADLFIKEAILEEDMAKRIMLSIIPALSSKLERHIGYDYKALRSAALGAKDLVKYGTKACITELLFYGAPVREDDYHLSELKLKTYTDKYSKARELAQMEKFSECLKLCTECFLDKSGWNNAYGGVSWAKISDTLFKIQEKRELLEYIKQDSMSSDRDPNTDYLEMEVEAMKDIIIYMNVFDGLAHNNGSVMPKVLREEQDSAGVSEVDAIKYQDRVQRLMDIKELEDPLVVYKQVQKIIEQSPNKHIFGDWIKRIRINPDFRNTKSPEETHAELSVIKLKKSIKNEMEKIFRALDAISEMKDTFIKETDNQKKKNLLRNTFEFHAGQILERMYYIKDIFEYTPNAVKHISPKIIENCNAFCKKISEFLYLMRARIKNILWDSNQNVEHIYSSVSLTNDVYTLKRLIMGIEGSISYL